MKHKNNAISFVGCLLILAAVMGIGGWLLQDSEPVQPADSCDQLTLYIGFSSGTEKVNIWQDEEGVYYFFLPSGAESSKITFGNLGSGDSLRLGDEVFGRKDDIRDFIAALTPEQTLDMAIRTEGQEQEGVHVRFLKSSNLSAMFIDLDPEALQSIHGDKSIRAEAWMRLVDSEGNGSFSGNLEYIRTRGNTSWNNDKKPYQFKLEQEAELLGMPAAKRWILLANYVDDTLMKNALVYRYAENYSDVESIKGEYVDLYINGSYVGNYYLCEKIEVGKNRVDITDMDAAMERINFDSSYENAVLYVSEDGRIKATQGLNNPEDITGGYIVEHITYENWEQADNAFMTGSGNPYDIISPSPATVEQAEYICGLFDEMEAAIGQEDGINPDTGKHFSEYLDIESWAAKYVMEETFHDPDAMIGVSMYLYKDSDSVDPLIYSGPMWDYDRAWGNYGGMVYRVDNARQVAKCGLYVDELMKYEEVSSLVYKKFEEEMVPYVENRARADIYDLNDYISASAEMDTIRWPGANGYFTDRNADVKYLSWFLEEKTDYLQNIWLGKGDYYTVTFLDYYGNVYDSYQVRPGELFSEVPTITAYVAVFAGWYVKGENTPYIPGLPVLADVTYEPRWIDMNTILQNELNGIDMDLSQLDPETIENIAKVLREMQNSALKTEE